MTEPSPGVLDPSPCRGQSQRCVGSCAVLSPCGFPHLGIPMVAILEPGWRGCLWQDLAPAEEGVAKTSCQPRRRGQPWSWLLHRAQPSRGNISCTLHSLLWGLPPDTPPPQAPVGVCGVRPSPRIKPVMVTLLPAPLWLLQPAALVGAREDWEVPHSSAGSAPGTQGRRWAGGGWVGQAAACNPGGPAAWTLPTGSKPACAALPAGHAALIRAGGP